MIREVVLRRFKKFEEETFDLRGHVILAGPNNCGKTTVLQAIAAWALAFRTWQTWGDYQRHGGHYTRVPLARQAFSAVALRSYDLLWTGLDFTDTIEIELQFSDVHALEAVRGRRVTMEFRRDSTEQIYVRPRNTFDLQPQLLQALNVEVAYVATVGGLSVEEPVYQPAYIQTLLGRQRPGDVVRNLLLQAAAQGPQWESITAAIQRLFGVELMFPQTPGGQIVCEYRKDENSPGFDILSAGSGFQQVVLLLACLFTRTGSIILVDEPDAHLHVFLQDTIFGELNRAAAQTGSQLIIATHSEVIFNSATPDQICVMLGHPRRLANGVDLQNLKRAVTVLQQSDLVAGIETPGILYLEGYTDLNLLREWARVLNHPVSEYLNRRPFWRAKQHPVRAGGAEVAAQEHFAALQLVNPQITGVWLIDSDGRAQIQPSNQAERERLNRLLWSRYETESYLVHPFALARYIDSQSGGGGIDAVRSFLIDEFEKYAGAGSGPQIVDPFIDNPAEPSRLVERYFAETKARTTIIGGILQQGGVHGMDYTRFSEIAAIMLPDEIHPEVIDKLNFIQQAFGL
jgi:predicted ATPase